MDPFAALADPTRRRLVELLAGGERTAGDLTAAVRAETGLSQPAVSQHLAALRAAGLVDVRVDGPRRVYTTRPAGLAVVAGWLAGVAPDSASDARQAEQQTRSAAAVLEPALDALATEVARGRRRRGPAQPSRAARAARTEAS